MLKRMIAAACLCTMVAQTRASDLSGQEIEDLLAGATVEIDTPVGTKLPVRYGRNGRLSGQAGGLAWYLGAATDSGRWWIASDQLCHKWGRWFSSEPQCLRLRKEGRRIRWRKRDGYAGTATIIVPAPIRIAAALSPPRSGGTKEAAAPTPPPAPATRPAQPTASPSAAAADAVQPPRPNAGDAIVPPVPVPARAARQKKQPASRRADPAKPERVAPPTFKVVNVRNDDVLNVRNGPSADSDVVGMLPPGSRGIAITSRCQSRWCPVQLGTAAGWVNSSFLAAEAPSSPRSTLRDAPGAPRACLAPATRALLERIERAFGAVQVISTCRPGATIPGSSRASRHASGDAVDFRAGSRKAAIVAWLIANHRRGGTMTYRGMDHIHVDIGPHFVSIADGPRWASWRDSPADFPVPR